MSIGKLIFRAHAIQRMFERRIREEEVRTVLETGERIENYPDAEPYPSWLQLGMVEARPIHVVAAQEPGADAIIVITVYEPDLGRWEPDFRRRKATK